MSKQLSFLSAKCHNMSWSPMTFLLCPLPTDPALAFPSWGGEERDREGEREREREKERKKRERERYIYIYI